MLWIVPAGIAAWALLYPKAAQSSIMSVGKTFGPYLPKGGLPVDNHDWDILARTIWGEARGEGIKGMQAVANVIMNRYRLAQKSPTYAKQFGKTVAEICQKRNGQYGQFSAWNPGEPNRALMLAVTKSDTQFIQALTIAKMALQFKLPDITGGADHYLNVAATRKMRGGSLPSWAKLDKKTADVGSHTYLRLV